MPWYEYSQTNKVIEVARERAKQELEDAMERDRESKNRVEKKSQKQ